MIQDALDGCEVNAQLAKRLEQVEARNHVQVVAAVAGWVTAGRRQHRRSE